MQLAQPWSFCPQCGLAVPCAAEPLAPPLPQPPLPHEKSSVPGAFGGLYFGVIAAPVLLIFGTMLCLTGLGAIVGVPMIIAGILAPLIGPLVGIREHKGKCPSCGTRVISLSDGQNHHCPSCDQDFIVSDHQVAKAG
jgi:predicted RNA-binding Zn-ribbon protein involved in translation (DUF1610 family)